MCFWRMTVIEFEFIRKMTLTSLGGHYFPMKSSNGAEVVGPGLKVTPICTPVFLSLIHNIPSSEDGLWRKCFCEPGGYWFELGSPVAQAS